MEEDTLVESAVGIGGVLLFTVATFVVGAMYTEEGVDGGGQLLTETGTWAMVVAIAGFVVLMSVLGALIARR